MRFLIILIQGPRKCTLISENPFGDLGNTVYDEATELARWSLDFHYNGMDNDEYVIEYLTQLFFYTVLSSIFKM